MEIMNWQEITMESETFSKIRESFNLLLQRLFQKMEQNSITQLVVVDKDRHYKGMVHIHYILREGVV